MNQRRHRLLAAQLGWMMTTVFILLLLAAFSYELFFVISLVGLVILTELVLPYQASPKWQRKLYLMIVLGILVFAYIVIRSILSVLPEGLF